MWVIKWRVAHPTSSARNLLAATQSIKDAEDTLLVQVIIIASPAQLVQSAMMSFALHAVASYIIYILYIKTICTLPCDK